MRPWWHALALAGMLLSGSSPRAADEPPLADREAELERLRQIAAAGRLAEALQGAERLLAALPEDARMVSWQYRLEKGQAGSAWRVGRHACFSADFGRMLRAVDAVTGKPTALAIPLHASPHLVLPAAAPSRALLMHGGRLSEIDVETGATVERLVYKMDPRIAPIVRDDGFVAVRGSRGRTVVGLGRDGKELWECALPGYVMVHPSVFGHLMVVQTRSGSYGSQATTGVDLRTGRRLWSDTVDAYGCGAAFGDDAQFVVEANWWMSPGATEGWLIGRDPRTGRRLWELRRPGGIDHTPLVDPRTGHVFAAFDTGLVVCVAGRTGELLWEARLTSRPRRAPAASYDPYWPAVALHGNTFLVLDEEGTLECLDTATGERVMRFVLVSPVDANGKAKSYDEVVAMPWFQDDRLIVPTNRGVTAYPLKAALGGGEPLELRVREFRTHLLLRQGQTDAAAQEVTRMRAERPGSPAPWECQAEVCDARDDVDGEIIARLWAARLAERQADPALRALAGLVRRLPCGPHPTAPLLLGGRVYVGSRDGRLRAWDASQLTPIGTVDLKVGVVGDLVHHDGAVCFRTENRRWCGASPDLKLLFDEPAPAPRVPPPKARDAYRARPDRPTQADGPPEAGGPALRVTEYRVNLSGDKPVAYGTGGAYHVDARLRPIRLLAPSPTRAFAAARNGGVVVVLSEQTDTTKDWLLEAWTEEGKKLPLRHASPRYQPHLDAGPIITPFGSGFLLVGRDLVYVEPGKAAPVWRFWPGGLKASDLPAFRGPVTDGDLVFFTHAMGDLYVFTRGRITGAERHF